MWSFGLPPPTTGLWLVLLLLLLPTSVKSTYVLSLLLTRSHVLYVLACVMSLYSVGSELTSYSYSLFCMLNYSELNWGLAIMSGSLYRWAIVHSLFIPYLSLIPYILIYQLLSYLLYSYLLFIILSLYPYTPPFLLSPSSSYLIISFILFNI